LKGQYIKELHSKGVYRSPFTKQKLEQLKLVDIIQVLNLVEEEIEKGAVYERKQCDYIYVTPTKKQPKAMKNNKKKK
jgi:hypothetical protein